MAVNRDHFALIAGIKNYPSWSPKLQGPDADAQDVVKWLSDAKGGGLPLKNIVMIKNGVATRDIAKARPSRDEIEGPLGNYINKANENAGAGEDGGRIGKRLYVYVAGHGLSPGVGQACLLAANASPSVPFHVNITKWVEDIAKERCFDEIVLWADCCMSNDTIQYATGAPRPSMRSQTASPRFMAFAAQYQKQAVERPIAGRTRGVFTYALLEALRGDAVDPSKGRVTASKLEGLLKSSVQTYLTKRDLRDASISQSPYIQLEDPEMVFGAVQRQLPTAAVAIKLPTGWQGKRVWIEDGTLTTVEEIASAAAIWAVKLGVGQRYALRRDGAKPVVINVASSRAMNVKVTP